MEGFEWDSEKEKRNITKHKLGFDTACRLWEEAVLERKDNRRDYGEIRLQALGKIDGRLMVVVFTWRGTARRIISARKANPREKRRYQAEIRRRSEGAAD